MSTAIRISIILFYMRIFAQRHSLLVKRLLHSLLVLQALYLIAFFIIPGFVCRPIYYSWQLEGHSTHCNLVYYNDTTVALYATSLVFDIIIFVFPIPLLAKLQLPAKKRFGLVGLFALSSA
jgi:hypothetical protein